MINKPLDELSSLRIASICLITLLLNGCGGGGDSTEPATPLTAVQKAISTGNALLVDDPAEFFSHSETIVAGEKAKANAIIQTLFNLTTDGQLMAASSISLNSITWNPSHDSARLASNYGFNQDVLQTNKAFTTGYDDQTVTIGVAGQLKESRSKYLVLGGNPMRNYASNAVNLNDQMHTWLKNSVFWLVDNKPTNRLNVTMAQLDESYYFRDESATRAWFTQQFGDQITVNDANDCDGSKLKTCVEAGVDLLVVSQKVNSGDQQADILAGIDAAISANTPILYLHLDGGLTDLGKAIFEKLHVTYIGDNYWTRVGLDGWDGTHLYDQVPSHIAEQQALLSRLSNRSFSVDLNGCDDKSCTDESKMAQEFYVGANSIREQLKTLDVAKTDVFASPYYEYEKSIILLADKYRQDIRFPMDKTTTDTNAFLRSYFADSSQYHTRKINPKQLDMGNFSRSDFSHITPTSVIKSMTSKPHFRSAGVYALPGQTFSVTRKDSSAVETKVFINSLRSGATHEFATNGYTRPKHLQSNQYLLEPNQTIFLTSAYGGPVHITFNANDLPVELQFDQVAQHPVWRSSADDETFAVALEKGDFDWAELVTPGFEVHSKLDKMLQSIGNKNWTSAQDMANATETYVHNFPHVLAAFQGTGIDRVAEISDYAETKGWQVDSIDIAKHMNADQATCGSGCSGNPYDAYWAFNPVGHGDLHELGHGLEKGRFRFSGWDYHASTNYYSYYSKSMFFVKTGKEPECQSLDFKTFFTYLQESRNQGDPAQYMRDKNLTSWSAGARIFIQMMMSAQEQGVLNNGWHLIARLHLADREFTRAIKTEEAWQAKNVSLAMSDYSLSESKAISNNDWLLIQISNVLGRDMRNYLNMWGLEYTDKAAEQVQALSLTPMPMNYFASTNTGYCKDMTPQTLAVDGSTVWPD
ncbi:ImpA family metalloprotease [Vibrio tapetis subsp. quintayensis]|uniref:ImpA family metalloprotease n=1 Tax=Vibrio tapetis TaxID=52443 RepID=UPI0025B2DE7F|nr:ImpA family metalloprotease [Vibrio tapetis]MDN3679791.1 ImpA family metalloprotease [Vibrio tapetis subsp. quintayensis]